MENDQPHPVHTSSVHVPAPRGQTRRAIVHEVKLTLLASLAVNTAWWMLVQIFGISFPFIHIALMVGALFLLPRFDHKEYPSDPSTRVFTIRGITNLVLFVLALIITSPFGGLYNAQRYVPDGVVPFILSYWAVVALMGFMRAAIHFAWILVKHFK